MKRQLLAAVLLSIAAAACLPADQCDEGASLCVETASGAVARSCWGHCSDFGCNTRWEDASCGSGGACVMDAVEGAMCVLSATRDPGCAGAVAHCDGNDRVGCSDGYAVGRSACSFDGLALVPQCISTGTGDAACIPAAAAPDPACPAGRSRYCSPTGDLVECVGGDAVFRSTCASCNAGSTRPCSGFLGDFCRADTDCASGLVCHTDGLGQKACTTPCTVTASGDDCFSSLGTGGLPYSTYAEIPLPAHQLACIAGYCTWH